MNGVVSLQDVANIVTFFAPGYFALQIYALAYAKRDRDFSRLAIESVVYSLPIVTLAYALWHGLFRQPAVTSLNVLYTCLVIATAIVAGTIVTILRTRWPLKHIAASFGYGSPDEDFVKSQLLRIDVKNPHKSPVTVKLRSGPIFSGTADRMSRYAYDGPMYYYFTNLAWYDEKRQKWDEREGGIIIGRDEIEYIETRELR